MEVYTSTAQEQESVTRKFLQEKIKRKKNKKASRSIARNITSLLATANYNAWTIEYSTGQQTKLVI